MRQSRRSTQGVTLTDLKEAEKTISRQGSQVEESDPIDRRSIQTVSPEITVTQAEREVETPPTAEETNRARERRRGRRERRSTGLVQLNEREIEENEFLDQTDYKQLSSLFWVPVSHPGRLCVSVEAQWCPCGSVQ
ncbi:UNVERIFIED_CONTAM: hypothetical protein FKN15_007226 [Acipenser sinensis]